MSDIIETLKNGDVRYSIGDYTVTVPYNPNIGVEILTVLLDYYVKQEKFSGEAIMQSDNSIIHAPVVLGDIADKCFKFKVTYE